MPFMPCQLSAPCAVQYTVVHCRLRHALMCLCQLSVQTEHGHQSVQSLMKRQTA